MQQHDVAVLEHGGAGGAGRVRVGVGQQALGHAHRDVRDAAGFDQGADGVVGLGVGGTFAEDDRGGGWADVQQVEGALDRVRGGELAGCGVDDA